MKENYESPEIEIIYFESEVMTHVSNYDGAETD